MTLHQKDEKRAQKLSLLAWHHFKAEFKYIDIYIDLLKDQNYIGLY